MTNIPRSALLDFAVQVRTAYPDAVLGFLGNSLGPSAVVDKYLSDTRQPAEQYIIPLSDSCLALEAKAEWPLMDENYTYKVETFFQQGYEVYKEALKKSAVAPEKIIGESRQLVVLDRVVDAKGLASFGYLWTKAAQEQGFNQRQIDSSLQLCALPNQEQRYANYVITNDKDPLDRQAGTFGSLGIDSDRIRELTQADDWFDDQLRFSPKRSLKFSDRPASNEKCYEKITEIYAQLEDNVSDMVTVSDYDLLAFQDPAEHRELRRKVAGLILEF